MCHGSGAGNLSPAILYIFHSHSLSSSLSPPHHNGDRAAPSLRSTLLIVFGLLVFAVAAILLLRCLPRRWASSSSHTHPQSAGGAAGRGVLAQRDDQADAGAAGRRHVEAEAEAEAEAGRIAAAAAAAEEEEEEEVVVVQPDDDTERLIASLPLFTTASPLAALPKNSPDCAVCLSPFDAGARLRLLPACRHAFHAACIDTWLRTNLVCPICRSAVSSPLPPLPVAAAGDYQEPEAAAVAKSASSSLSGWWSQGYRRDEPRQWDMEAARRAGREEEEEEPWALVALARWIFGLHDC